MVVILTGGKLLDNVGLDGLGLIMIVKGPLGGGGGGGEGEWGATNIIIPQI